MTQLSDYTLSDLAVIRQLLEKVLIRAKCLQDEETANQTTPKLSAIDLEYAKRMLLTDFFPGEDEGPFSESRIEKVFPEMLEALEAIAEWPNSNLEEIKAVARVAVSVARGFKQTV